MHAQLADNPSSRDSFSVEMTKYVPALQRGAALLTRNEDAAADLTQETLAKAWAARLTFTPGTNLKGWLFTIMRNQFRSEKRRAWRQVSWNEESAGRISAPRDGQTWSIELKDAIRAMGMLSQKQRDAVVLAGVGGYSSEDVAAITHCHTTAVKSRVCRARHAMRAMLNGTMPLKARTIGSDEYPIDDLLHQLQVLTANVSSTGPAAIGST